MFELLMWLMFQFFSFDFMFEVSLKVFFWFVSLFFTSLRIVVFFISQNIFISLYAVVMLLNVVVVLV